MRCMIPFWIHLLTGIHHIQVLFVWVQFDQKNALLKILNPGQRREGTSSNHCIKEDMTFSLQGIHTKFECADPLGHSDTYYNHHDEL